MNKQTLPLDPRTSVVYFDIVLDDDSIQEDCKNPEAPLYDLANVLMRRPERILGLENAAMKEASNLLRACFGNEGHDHYGNLVCRVSINVLQDLVTLRDVVLSRVGGGDDIVYFATPYFSMMGFTLFPQGVNRGSIPFSGWDDWIDDHRKDHEHVA